MQQIQCIDAESRYQPLFAGRATRVWKAAESKTYGSRINDSAESAFSEQRVVDKVNELFLG
jgi:hypothetical protein